MLVRKCGKQFSCSPKTIASSAFPDRLQILEGDLITTILESSQYIGHYHTAEVPGRHDLDELHGDKLSSGHLRNR
jgi:hypothetical protein